MSKKLIVSLKAKGETRQGFIASTQRRGEDVQEIYQQIFGLKGARQDGGVGPSQGTSNPFAVQRPPSNNAPPQAKKPSPAPQNRFPQNRFATGNFFN